METEYIEPLTEVYENERTEIVESVLKTLTPREVTVLKRHIYEGRTLRDVGRELGVGFERVRQMEDGALRKLRHPMRLRKLEECLVSTGGKVEMSPDFGLRFLSACSALVNSK